MNHQLNWPAKDQAAVLTTKTPAQTNSSERRTRKRMQNRKKWTSVIGRRRLTSRRDGQAAHAPTPTRRIAKGIGLGEAKTQEPSELRGLR